MPRHLPIRRILLYALIAGAGVARITAAFQHNPLDMLDSDPGRHWAHIRDPLLFDPLSGIDPIGYQLWLGAIAKLTIGDRMAMAACAAALSLITPWIWYRFARELFPDKDTALLCWALIGWVPSWISIFSYTMPETLMLPLFGTACWAIWRALRRMDTASMVWALLFSLATLLTKLTPLPVLLLGMAAVLYVQPRRMRAFALCVAVSFAMLIGPAYRSYRILHVWAPFGYPAMNTVYYRSGCAELTLDLTDGGYHWYYGFASPHIGQKPLAPLSQWQSARSGTVHININLPEGAAGWRNAIHNYSSASWPSLWRENAVFLLFGESWPDNNPERFWDHLQTQTRWLWAALIALAAAGNIRLIWRRRIAALLSLAVVGTVAGLVFQTTGYVEGRYRKPFEGLLIINAVWLAKEWRSREDDGTSAPGV